MQSQPDIEIDVDRAVRAWSAAIPQYLATTNKDTADVLNTKMFFVARRAWQMIKRASKTQIENELGVQRQYFTKRGKLLKKPKLIRATVAENIILSRMIANKEAIPERSKIRALARQMVGRRLRAVGSLASGMIGIARRFSRYGGAAPSGPNVKMRGQGRPARATTQDPAAVGEYRLTVNNRGPREIHPNVIKSVAKALEDEAADTVRQVARRLEKHW